MMIGRIDGATRTIGRGQGYLGLPVRDGTVICPVNGPATPCMTTAWHPSPAELAALNAGASIHVRLLGTEHPPILVEVGPLPARVVVGPPGGAPGGAP
jgi:hypothetical protein